MHPRHYVLGMFAVLLAVCMACPLNAQVKQQGTKQTVTAKPETVYVQAIQPENTKQLDRTISVLNIIITAIGVLGTIVTLAFMVAIALGFFEINKWREIRVQAEQHKKDVQQCLEDIKKYLAVAKQDKDEIKKTKEEADALIVGIKQLSLKEKPSKEVKAKLDEYGKKIEMLEALGSPLTPENYYNKGIDFYYKSKYEVALSAFEKAIELKPVFAQAWCNKGVVLSELGNNEEALKAHEKAIELNPNYANAWDNKGIVLSKLKRYGDALKAHEKAIVIKPDFVNAWFNKACVYSLMGDKQNSLISLSKTIKLDSTRKEDAKSDEDFKTLWTDPDFIKLVS